MEILTEALHVARTSIPDCIAAGYIDIWNGKLLQMTSVDAHPPKITELLAAATTDLYLGPNVTMIESLFKKTRGFKEDGYHFFEDIIVTSANWVHIFMRSNDEQHVACFVCRKSANLGMVLNRARSVMPGLRPPSMH